MAYPLRIAMAEFDRRSLGAQTARTAMQAVVRFDCFLLLLALAGCETQQLDPARVGRELETDRSNRNLNILANREDKGTCASIGSAFASHFRKMEALHGQAEVERRGPPSTIALAYGRLFGTEGAGYAATEELRQERAKVDRLDAVLAAKGCSSIKSDMRRSR
jgi:hypothetical protein